MYKMLLVSCLALALTLLARSAPTSDSTRDTQVSLEQLLLDLQMIREGVTRNPKLTKLLKFPLYFPNEPSKLEHLQCLEEELNALEQVLHLAEHKHFPLKDTKDFISNINVTVLKLKGSTTPFTCELKEEETNIVEFLEGWISFCQKIISTLT